MKQSVESVRIRSLAGYRLYSLLKGMAAVFSDKKKRSFCCAEFSEELSFCLGQIGRGETTGLENAREPVQRAKLSNSFRIRENRPAGLDRNGGRRRTATNDGLQRNIAQQVPRVSEPWR
jgi:hypothetical protein